MPDRTPRRNPEPLRAPLLAAILALALAGALASAEGTKVPGRRFNNGVFTAPGNEFTLRCNDWLLPGARAEEQQVAATTRGVTFADGSGGVFGVVRTIDAPDTLTVEKIAGGFKVDQLLRDKRIVTTPRGQELRLLGVNPDGSTSIVRTGKGGQTTRNDNDLFGAWSVFIDHRVVYRVSASVTRLGNEADSIMFERANRKLEAMLAGLTIRNATP